MDVALAMPDASSQDLLQTINGPDSGRAAAILEPLIERAAWLVPAILDCRPFADAEALSASIEQAIFSFGEADRLRLLRGHPELAGVEAQAGEMTAESASEQGRLGLDRLGEADFRRLGALNAAYRARFGFPFVLALHRVVDLAGVFALLERRLKAEPEAEMITALGEVASVTRSRCYALLGGPTLVPAGGISVHAVNVASGRPAEGLGVRLWRMGEAGRSLVASGACSESGVLDHPCAGGEGVRAGLHEAEFDVGCFFRAAGEKLPAPAFLEVATFRFGIADATQHFHLPLKFTPWGYSLFRGGL